MGDGAEVTATQIRRSLKKEVFAAVQEAERRGWKIRTLGHGWRVYCPCGDPRGAFSIGHTPANPAAEARRILRNLEKCPNMHQTMR